jgi:hypothetical protein
VRSETAFVEAVNARPPESLVYAEKMSWLRASLVVVASLGWLLACSDGPHPTNFPDVGPHDAARPVDTAMDTNTDAPGPSDTGPDANDDAGGGHVCTFDPAHDLFDLGNDSAMPRLRTVSVGAGPTGWQLAFNQPNGIYEEVWLSMLPSIGMGSALANQFTMDSATANGPAITWNGAGYTLAWYSNHDGNFEIYAAASNADPRMAGAIHRITTDDVSTPLRDDSPAVAFGATDGMLLWVRQEHVGTTVTPTLRAQRIMRDGTPIGASTALTTTGHVPSQPVITALDDGSYLVGWTDPTGDAVVYPLSATGTLGAVQVLSSEHNTSGTLDFAFDGNTGAAVFDALEAGVRPQVRMVRIETTGVTSGPETILTVGTGETGRDVSIAALRGGFAVVYRALDASMMRVLLIDLALHEVQRFDLGAIEANGGRAILRASGDGSLLVAWNDVTTASPPTAQMRAARITCN